MEMEMDIPLPEELEWLETNALLHEEVDEEEYYAEEELLKASSPISDLPVSENQTSRKRPLEGPDGDSVKASNEKRNKTAEGTGTDEDWLRYSPMKNLESDPAGAENSESDPAIDAALADDVAPVVVEEKVLCRFASEIEGDCFSVTGPCGDRVYAKMSPGETSRDVKRSNIERPLSGLLSEPINVLMERVEQETFRKVLEASSGSVDDSIHPTVPIVSEQLWVDKYAPNSFTELLSDEQTNREVLLWLKQWDSCVFGSQIRTTTDDVLSALRRHSSLAQHQKVSDSRSSFSKNRAAPFGNQTFKQSNGLNQGDAKSKNISELWNKKSMVNDQLEHKVLLLCGPPGLGKTTLAHVAAKHCGYRVVEINASDDRSASTIESKILDVVQMNSVMADSKPKCLVIDEIDGALGSGKGAVEVILKMVAAEKRSVLGKGNVAQEVDPGKASSRKGSKAATLSRPVICICNDIYAPALRPLRQVAKVHTFVQPTISRVVNRLKYICNKEGFKTSSIALTALAEYTECDIRSCLNTLQFLNKKREALNTLEVGSQVVGRKDISKSVLDVWKEVFQKRRVKRERKSSNSCTSEPMDFGILYSLISNRGDCELTMDGIHENFLQLHYHDPMMHKTVKCLNALGVSDSMAQYAIRTQQMSLYVYQPSIAIAIRSLVAQVEKPNIEWPKSFQRYRAMLMEKKDLLKLWHTKIAPSISRHLTIESFVEDAISPLLHILSPPTLRPVALHLLSEREKGDLAQLVDTMVSYSITYKNLKPEPQPITQRHEATSDASTLSFDPPIGDFVNFKGYHCGRSGLSLAMKQILVHEVEKRKILRESIGRPVHLNDENEVLLPEGSAKPFSSKTNSTTANFQNNTEDKKPVLTQNLWKANGSRNSTMGSNKSIPVGVKLKATGDATKPSGGSTSFFDRFRKSSSKSSQNADDALQKSATSERDSRPLLFKYNEGFTNAVKRPVRMRELLL
ncbi:uncharacterized protein LOC131240469 [Magnolia sinica]|uniref:uncharacterized protein LOC131240469 n=1 Tax=Magnolia sinica TaxID=86752 RepID=UPI00265860AF|nr:uncharacterized protein LOC131240469 [Magnolia sinica]